MHQIDMSHQRHDAWKDKVAVVTCAQRTLSIEVERLEEEFFRGVGTVGTRRGDMMVMLSVGCGWGWWWSR